VQFVVDASVWIDYFTGAATPQVDVLDGLIGNWAVTVTDSVLAEVLHGLPDEVHRRQAQEALLRFWLIEDGGFDVAVKSAVNYHTLRARDIPVRMAECRLATFCIDQGFALLHSSPGYEPFEKYLGLKVARPAGK
jgi:predicted nucleic acid-binding protein